ncbi:MAG: hypothetical protein AAB420_02450 [Patescibacteria group bacterium]
MKKTNLRVGVIGLGMVGDPIRRWFEEMKGYIRGKDLFCFDVDPKKDFHDDINQAEVIFVAVPTPSPKGGGADLSILHAAIKTVNDGKIIVIKSTVPPGTAESLQKKYPKKKFIFSPEFLTESQVWNDFVRPDRQILGATEKARDVLKEVQMLLPIAPFSRPWSSDYTKKEVTATEAELAKYASNVFGYIKVIYGNILADICSSMNINYEAVREMISADPRIGPSWLDVNHGNYCGAGGYCFPKDMNALIGFMEKNVSAKHNDGLPVLKAVRTYNRNLLKKQNLSEEVVSRHDRDINVRKRKKAR